MYAQRQQRHEERFEAAGVIGVASWHKHRLVGLRCANVRRASDYGVRHGQWQAGGGHPSGRWRAAHGVGTNASVLERWDCELTTKQFRVGSAMVLRLNADTGPVGEIDVSVLSVHGRPLAHSSLPPRSDGAAIRLRWDLPSTSRWQPTISFPAGVAAGKLGGMPQQECVAVSTATGSCLHLRPRTSRHPTGGAPPYATLAPLLRQGALCRLRFRMRGPARLFAFQFEHESTAEQAAPHVGSGAIGERLGRRFADKFRQATHAARLEARAKARAAAATAAKARGERAAVLPITPPKPRTPTPAAPKLPKTIPPKCIDGGSLLDGDPLTFLIGNFTGPSLV